LAKPITRSEIVTSKMLCFISNVVILNIVTSITLFITCELFKNQDFSMKMFMLLCVAPMIMHLTFASIGYFISTLIKKKRGILSISLGIVLVTYFFSIASKISDKLEFLKYFTPFEYVDASKIITNKNLDFNYMILMLVLNIVFISATYLIYKRKDISV
jgi:ABC-2 type transport system permease protein